ncbi:MAG: S-layer homology domain-containing protein [Oscillospiraceae bacterium]|nr:S-layer homology domain-containing protein [Oscillospiraceae bacterium]
MKTSTNWIKHILATVLAVVMVFSSGAICAMADSEGVNSAEFSGNGDTEMEDEGNEVSEVVNPFTDVNAGNLYYDAVLWAYDQNITIGTGDGSTFSPSNSCTRAQFVTFLWRMEGGPKPESSTTVFTDISSFEYYNDAVLWAYETGITNGTSTTTFSPNASITRAQAITCLYRYEKCPAVSGAKIFADVNTEQYYAAAVQWAAEQGITNGTSDTTFSPETVGTQGQMVTFLYRYKVEPLSNS